MSGKRYLYPDWKQGGIDDPTICGKGMTRQSDFEGSDINAIMSRFEATGVFPENSKEALFTDVSALGSFADAQNVILRAQGAFNALPSHVRARFDNDPVRFLDWCSDPASRPELEELGLVEKADVPEVVAPAPQSAA